jgi:glucose-1-phosphate adenylyltransferase
MDTKNQSRFVSLLTRDTLALVLAGGRGSRLYELTDWRAKPGVPFGGKFRIIDFPLSNCINSGIRRIGVLTQYKAHSLIRHLVRGWSHFQGELDEFVEILPASQRGGSDEWYQGTADAVYQNIDIMRTHKAKYILILSGDHIYKMDYGDMLIQHVEQEADMTISCLEVPVEEAAGAYGVMTVDKTGRIIGFNEKPEKPTEIPGMPGYCLASMGNYLFNTGFLYEQLIKDADTASSTHDFGKDIIPSIIENYRVFAQPFRDRKTQQRAYWRDVGTLDAFWEANMELVSITPELNLYDDEWPILTHQAQLAPAKFIFDDKERRGIATDSMVSGGCLISGAKIKHSLLFSNVKVHSYAEVTDSVIMPDVDIGESAIVRKAIIDRGCSIAEDMVIGVNHDDDRERGFRVTESGVVLVTPDMLNQSIHVSR